VSEHSGQAAERPGSAGERQVPFFCPYCGEEELRPAAAESGSWACLACARSFQLRFTGLVAHQAGGVS